MCSHRERSQQRLVELDEEKKKRERENKYQMGISTIDGLALERINEGTQILDIPLDVADSLDNKPTGAGAHTDARTSGLE